MAHRVSDSSRDVDGLDDLDGARGECGRALADGRVGHMRTSDVLGRTTPSAVGWLLDAASFQLLHDSQARARMPLARPFRLLAASPSICFQCM